ncbi:MAG TPA: tetratricopeptide repeat protein [Thermoplasmata archaeon]|nr:tetratricopeptide repeat protein [Thermoplasmata archaeon]
MVRLVLSQNERILLHLSELERHRDEPDVPMAASQEGIAERLDTQVFNASRALSSLESEGLVFDRLAHVRGAPKRRRAYFLTEKGRAAAQAIKSDIGKRSVVIEHAGKTQELPVDEAVRRFTSMLGRPVSLSEVAELGRQFETILSSALAGPSQPILTSKEFAMRAHGRPKVGSFFGREQELRLMEDSLAGKDVSAILLWGMPGIGKSTLASRLFEGLSGRRSLFWYSFREWDTEGSFLFALVEFLSAAGRSNSSAAFRRGIGRAELYLPLLNDLTDAGLVLFLDDVQKPAKDVSSLVHILVEAARSSDSSKVILISRTVPSTFSRTAPGNVSIELAGLDRDSAWRFAQSLNAKDSVRLVEESHGHPLLLNLMARGGVAQAKGDVISFIEREVYSALSPVEMRVLEILSIYRHPVSVDALKATEYGVIAGMRQKALVTEQEEGIWTHDLLREFFVSHMTSEVKSTLHNAAAAYCEQQDGIDWGLEALYHWVEAGGWGPACRIATARAVELAKEFPQETHSLLSRIDLKKLSERDRAEILFIRGQISEALGMHEAALHDLTTSLSLLGDADPAKKALVLGTLATLQSEAERWSESLSAHQNALRLYERSDDKEGQAREWMNIGGVHRKKGDHVKAKEAYDRALSLSTKAEDRSSQAASLNNIALLEWDQGNLGDAELRLKEAVKLAHAVKDHDGEARGLENLAGLYRVEGRLAEAASVFLESAEAFRRAGDVSESKRLHAMSAETLGMFGKFSQGIDLCEKAFERAELRRSRGLFQRSPRYDPGDVALATALVELLRASGDPRRAQKELIRYEMIADSMEDTVLKARGRVMLAIIQEETGNLDGAIKSLSEAEAVLRTAGSHEGLIAVHMRGGVISEKLGDDASALRHYEEAARHAEMCGDKTALGLAEENIKSMGTR